ncbi:MAG: TolC family protein [Pirellulaceae bacterium]
MITGSIKPIRSSDSHRRVHKSLTGHRVFRHVLPLVLLSVVVVLSGCVSSPKPEADLGGFFSAPPDENKAGETPLESNEAEASNEESLLRNVVYSEADQDEQTDLTLPIESLRAPLREPVAPPEITAAEFAYNEDVELTTDAVNGTDPEVFPIDLPTALQLAGANSLQVALASERIDAAYTRVDQAEVSWLPSVRLGFVYNRHNGRLQAAKGEVIESTRGSFFTGGGLGTGNAPLTGGSGGPPRMMVDLSLAEVFFEPLAARRMVDVVVADHTAVFNQTLLNAAHGYLRFVAAQATLNTMSEIRRDFENLVKLTEIYAQAGAAKKADVQRAKADLAFWNHTEFRREEEFHVAGVELARVLRLEPDTVLTAGEDQLLSWHFFGDKSPQELMAQAIAARPELSRAFAKTRATTAEVAREYWRPYLPHLVVGFSGGVFGGEAGSQWKQVSDRTDVDLGAVWEFENLGLGNYTRRQLAANRHRQARLEADIERDHIAAQVVAAHHRCRVRQKAIAAAETRLETATKSMDAALLGIREGVQLPLEAQQSVTDVANARLAYVQAIADYNAAQIELLYAVGTPINDQTVIASE